MKNTIVTRKNVCRYICANRKILMTSNSELRINPNSSIAQIAETT